MKVLMIDNYDSFTYNLVQYLGELGANVETIRNDAITPQEIFARSAALKPDRIVISARCEYSPPAAIAKS